jgi:hypothetical protein
MRRLTTRREAIALTLPETGKTVYYAARPEWDGAWYTADINRAKVYRHPAQAAEVIRCHDWTDLNSRVIDPRNVPGYVDKPSAAARRRAKASAWVKRALGNMRGGS